MTRRFALLAALLAAPDLAAAQAAQDLTLVAPDGQTVAIDRDGYGVPHISASTETALFYGQGFAVAQDRLFQMEQFWRTATGRLAEIAGAAVVAQDKQIRTVYYTPAERAAQFAALSAPVQAMMTAYVAGVNAYIDSTAANPDVYLPVEYTRFPLNQVGIERWDTDRLVALMQFFMRRFGEIGGQELTRMAELRTMGPDWFEANRPVNDPTAPTTIQTGVGPPALAGRPASLDGYPDGVAAFAARGAAHLQQMNADMDGVLTALGVPLRFGSFAAVVGADLAETGDPILLGAPQMGAPDSTQKAVTSEVELVGPGGLHVAGMTVPGIPGVIIGRTAGRTWTLTTGYTDNVDTYIETLTGPGQYLYNGAVQSFQPFPETFRVLGGADQTDVHYRTVHGPVYFLDAGAGYAASWKYSFWNRELEMVEAFYDIWRAASIEEFEDAGERVTMSFNLFYADDGGDVAFWHVGTYPVRPGTVDPRLPAMGTGGQEWVGEVAFASLPQQRNPAAGYFVNWNNKPAAWWNQGDNVNWATGRGRSYDGVRALDVYLRSVGRVSFDEVQELTRVVRQNAAYPEYPGTYQQVVQFSPGCTVRAENVVPPGQSGFVNRLGVPSPNSADQWALYQSSTVAGDVLMKPFAFDGACVAGEPGPSESGFDLSIPAPNPASGPVALRVRLAEAQRVRVSVVDALGREVAVLSEGALPAGEHAVSLDAAALAPGLYVVRLAGEGGVASRRVVVVR